MSVFQAQSVHQSSLQPSILHQGGSSAWLDSQSETVHLSLMADIVGCFRRVRRSITQLDACDMTPERAVAYQQAFERAIANYNICDSEDEEARQRALEAFIPLLYNIRVPSTRAQYLRRVAALTTEYAERPEHFMQQMLPAIELYGRGFSPCEVLQAARL